jgi:hypothetical protein
MNVSNNEELDLTQMKINWELRKVDLIDGFYRKKKSMKGVPVDWELLLACTRCHRPNKKTPTKSKYYKRCFSCNQIKQKQSEDLKLKRGRELFQRTRELLEL